MNSRKNINDQETELLWEYEKLAILFIKKSECRPNGEEYYNFHR